MAVLNLSYYFGSLKPWSCFAPIWGKIMGGKMNCEIPVGKVYLCYTLSYPGHNTQTEMPNGGSGTLRCVMMLEKYVWTFKAVWRTRGPWGSFKSVAFKLREVILNIFDLYLYIWNVIPPTLPNKTHEKKKNERKYSGNTRCILPVWTDFVISLNKECFHSKANMSVSQEESCIVNDNDYFHFITIFTNIYFFRMIQNLVIFSNMRN